MSNTKTSGACFNLRCKIQQESSDKIMFNFSCQDFNNKEDKVKRLEHYDNAKIRNKVKYILETPEPFFDVFVVLLIHKLNNLEKDRQAYSKKKIYI